MPQSIDWTPESDAAIVSMRGKRMSWDAIASYVGVSRWAVIMRAKAIGVPALESVSATPDDGEPDDRLPLPAGHSVSWGAVIAGSCLAGMAYPLPVFS